MDRRTFIKWSGFMTVSVASTTILSACGGSDTAPSNNAGGAPAGGGPLSFSQGVASGDPQPDSVVLWTRVSGGDGTSDVNVGVQVSTTADFTSLVVNTTVAASA